jgi:ATP-dependent Lhr-like helicase
MAKVDDASIVRALGPRVFHAVLGGFPSVRPVQREAIPPVISGQGVLVAAPTASGKTEAALAPLLSLALNDSNARPFALWICPTRALVNDLRKRIEPCFRRLELHLGVRTGEHKLGLKSGPAVVLTTPESLDVVLSSRKLAKSLTSVRAVVVDETHLFLSSARGLQLLMLLQRLEGLAARRLLRIGLSATIANPESAAKWLAGDGPTLTAIRGSGARDLDLSILGAHPNGIDQTIATVTKGLERGRRKQLVFVNARNEADQLAERLEAELPGVPCYLHFSSLPVSHREDVERRLKELPLGVCVATSTLELGVDIGDIDATVLYGAPGSVASLLQRVGRGNRRDQMVRAVGVCRTHDPRGNPRPDIWERDALAFAGSDLAISDGVIDAGHAQEFWSVVVQQAFSLARYNEKIGVIPLRRAAGERIAPFADEDGCAALLANLEGLGYLEHRSHGDYYALDDKGWEWLESLQIWSNFSDRSEPLPIVQGGEVLDRVAWSNRYMLGPGTLIRVKGKTREVREVGLEHVEVIPPVSGGTPLVLQRLGGRWPVSLEISRSLRSLGRRFSSVEADLEPALRPWLSAWVGRFGEVDPQYDLPVEVGEAATAMTFLGGTGNRLLAEAIRSSGERAKAGDWGVTVDAPLFLKELNLTAAQLGAIAGRMSDEVDTSVHFSMLPDSLKEAEVRTSVADPRVVDEVLKVPSLRQVVIRSAPPPPIG